MMRWLAGVCIALMAFSAQADFSTEPQAGVLLATLRDRYGFSDTDLASVRTALIEARFVSGLIHTEHHAKERTSGWDQYEPIHVNERNVTHGLEFLVAQRRWLSQAEDDYGVPPPVIAAILGVETKWGTYTGRYRVLDSLTTLGFNHPTRSAFFMSELTQYFVWCRDSGTDPLQVLGSYAGAMSAAQFMPSNYRKLGVDYNGDGQVNLWSLPDAIGSIARYLTQYDPQRSWKRGMPMMVRAHLTGPLAADFPRNQPFPLQRIADLRAAGVVPDVPLPDSLRAGLVELPRETGTEEWIALDNFYAVMSYNPQVFYAMAVAQLAEQLSQAQGSQP